MHEGDEKVRVQVRIQQASQSKLKLKERTNGTFHLKTQ